MDALNKMVPLLQVVTNATLTLVGICIAVASLIVAYRNNFGWGPFVLVRRQRTEVTYNEGLKRVASLEFEVWNRRKYPIIIRKARMTFASEKVRKPMLPSGDKWEFRGNNADHREEHTLAPTTQETLKIQFSFDETPPGKYRTDFTIYVTCFDPRTKKEATIRTGGTYYGRERKDAVWG
jgi:hypothetical protein